MLYRKLTCFRIPSDPVDVDRLGPQRDRLNGGLVIPVKDENECIECPGIDDLTADGRQLVLVDVYRCKISKRRCHIVNGRFRASSNRTGIVVFERHFDRVVVGSRSRHRAARGRAVVEILMGDFEIEDANGKVNCLFWPSPHAMVTVWVSRIPGSRAYLGV